MIHFQRQKAIYRNIWFFNFLVIILFMLGGCGGGSGNSAANPNKEFTLQASAGLLNDGSGLNGLSVLVTLRDSGGWGPTDTWTIDITDPAGNGYSVYYYDPSPGSYMQWEWPGSDPSSGTYHISATNGTTTLTANVNLTLATIQRPAPNAGHSGNDITITWPAVTGAGSYGYEVCQPDLTCESGITTGTQVTVSALATGDYFIQISAYAIDLVSLYQNHTSSPGLVPEKVSEYSFTFPIGGDQTSADYSFTAVGGILDYGLRGPGNVPIYGLALWTSVQDITNAQNPTAPAGDWNITVTDPNGFMTNYIYPAGGRQYAYWYYNLKPVSSGTYTVTATYGTASETASFTIGATPAALTPLAWNQISGTLVPNAGNNSVNDISITWPAVTNAQSYYVSLWATVWDNSAKQYDYEEVWGAWVKDSGAATTSTRVFNGTVQSGLSCDVFVTAHQLDMTAAAPPLSIPTRADMSENYYGSPLAFPTP